MLYRMKSNVIRVNRTAIARKGRSVTTVLACQSQTPSAWMMRDARKGKRVSPGGACDFRLRIAWLTMTVAKARAARMEYAGQLPNAMRRKRVRLAMSARTEGAGRLRPPIDARRTRIAQMARASKANAKRRRWKAAGVVALRSVPEHQAVQAEYWPSWVFSSAGCRDASGYYSSLTFVPAGPLDPEREVLVSYKGNNYLRIDLSTGKAFVIGSPNVSGSAPRWVLTGDVVSVQGVGTYAALHPSSYGPTAKDTLVEVDPQYGRITKVIGSTRFQSLVGLAYGGWCGVRGLESRHRCPLRNQSGHWKWYHNPAFCPPADTTFWGAGVTTSAPVSAPR